MTTVRTNLSVAYTHATLKFNGTTTSADIPWIADFDADTFNQVGAAVLTQDKGRFEAGLYVELGQGNWRLALAYQSLMQYAVGTNAALTLVFNQPTTTTETGATVFKNGVLTGAETVAPSPYDVYTVLTPRSTGGGTSTDSQTLSLTGTTLAISGGNNVDLGTLPIKETTTTISGTLSSGNTIGTYTNEVGAVTPLRESVTSLTTAATDLVYLDEASASHTIALAPLVKNAETVTTLTNALALGHTIGTYTNEAGTAVDLKETNTTVTSTVAGHAIATFTNEAGAATTVNETVTALTRVAFDSATSTLSVDYTDEAGTSSTKSAVIATPPETVTTLTGVLGTGHTVGTYTNEAGTAVNLKESVTTLTTTSTNLVYTDEAGATNNVVLDALVKAGETVTSLVPSVSVGNAIATYTNEAGATVSLNETITAVTDTITGHAIATFNNEAGTATTVNETATVLTSVLSSGLKLGEYTNESGTVTELFSPTVPTADGVTLKNTSGVFSVAPSVVDTGTSTALDVSSAEMFVRTITGATTFTFTNAVAAGSLALFSLELTNAGTNVTFPASVKWDNGPTPPTLTAAGRDLLCFYSYDGGTQWTGFLAVKDAK